MDPAPSAVSDVVARQSADDRLLAELVSARNARWAKRLREDEQHLAELNADGAPCSWKAMLGPNARVAFRLTSGAQPFAYLDGGVFAARFSTDAPEQFQVKSDNGGFVVQAFARGADISFHPTVALVLGGFVHLHPSAVLGVSRASETTALLSYELDPSASVGVEPRRLTNEAPCSRASLLERRFPLDPSAGGSADVADLVAASKVPLKATPEGPVVARLTVDARCVKVLERRADQVRVLIERDDDSLVGWIGTGQLDPKPGCTATLGHGAGRSARDVSDLAMETARCAQEVPLGVEQGSRRKLVGFIRADTHFVITGRRPDRVLVTARDMDLTANKARFYVPTSSLASCTIHAPPSLGAARRDP